MAGIYVWLYSISLSGLPSAPGSAALAEGVKSRILSLGNASVIYLSKDNIVTLKIRLNATHHAMVIPNWLGTSHFVSPGKYQSSMQHPVSHALSRRGNSGVLIGTLTCTVFHAGTASARAGVVGSNLYIIN